MAEKARALRIVSGCLSIRPPDRDLSLTRAMSVRRRVTDVAQRASGFRRNITVVQQASGIRRRVIDVAQQAFGFRRPITAIVQKDQDEGPSKEE